MDGAGVHEDRRARDRAALSPLADLQLPAPTGRGLDFGCGVGRLSQALARRMSRVIGADISPVMIELARRLNRYPDRAEYLCTAETGLETLPPRSFQCIYSNIVLQHVPSDFSVRYLNEFFRLLAPDGLLVFQLPSHKQEQIEAEITPMPDAAYRASIDWRAFPPLSQPERSSRSRSTCATPATTNGVSRRSVPSRSAITGSTPRGELMVAQDDGRAPLLQIVPPGLAWPVLVTMHAPAVPGRYVGEIDLVHEGVTWFADKGSPHAALPDRGDIGGRACRQRPHRHDRSFRFRNIPTPRCHGLRPRHQRAYESGLSDEWRPSRAGDGDHPRARRTARLS